MKSYIIAASALLLMASCSSKKQENTAEAETPKSLILYYSQTGTTKAVADQLAGLINADTEEIVLATPYPGSYDETIKRCIEERAQDVIPEIVPVKADIAAYDTVYLGYPIWFGTYARPILGVLEANDFDGKVIVPFCTFGSGGLEASTADLREALPKAKVAEGYGVRTARIAAATDELPYFLITNGYMAGEVEPLPDYSELQPVTDTEIAIFDAACGDYMFPLGTPVSFGKRETAKGVDYKYTAVSKGMDGNDTETVIYVTVANGDDTKPEFTKVVR